MELEALHSIQQAVGNPVLDTVFPILTHLGQLGALWVVVGLLLLTLRAYRFWGIVLLVALAMVGLLDELLLKALVARPRPFLADPSIQLLVPAPSGYSFPSGHAGSSFAAATVIAFMPIARGWKACAWVLAALVAFTRLYLFVHYPTDVVVGIALGVLYGIVAVKLAQAMRRRFARTRGV